MKVTGKIIGADIDFRTKKPILRLAINELNDFKQMVDELNDKEKLSIEIKQFRERRSLDANAYAWHLIGEIANVLRADKDEIYLDMLRKYGQQFVCKIPNKHKSKFERSTKYWEIHESLPPEENAQYYRVLIGSSGYDKQEMSVLIDGIVYEAKGLDIQTETPDQIAKMKSLWGE